MTLYGVPVEKGVCLFGAALMDPCAGRPIAGVENKFLCAKVREVTLEENFTGGDSLKLAGGCSENCVVVADEYCFDEGKGSLMLCTNNVEFESLTSGNPTYERTDGAVSYTVGMAGPAGCQTSPRIWVQYWRKLVYDKCVSTANLPKYRLYIWPNGIIRPKQQTAKEGIDYTSYDLANFLKVRPPDGYTGPFGDIPANFFASYGPEARPWYKLDVVSLPAGQACDVLSAVA